MSCTLCTLGDEPGCDACRAVEPEGERAPSIVYRVVHVPTGEWYIGKHKLPEGWADPFRCDGYPFRCADGRTRLARKLAKHPAEEFRKDVLAVLPTEEAALWLEGGLIGAEAVSNPRCLNLCEGGRAPVGLSEESRERHREGVTAAVRRQYADPDYRERMAAIQRTPESRAANRERGIARMAEMTPEERRALMAPAMAVTRTPEVRAKAAESNRDRCAELTPEERAAMVVPAVEASRAPEVVARRSATRRRRYAEMTTEERELLTARQQAGHTPESYRRGWASATDEERAARVKKATEARRRAVEERRRRGEPAVKPATEEVRAARSAALRERFKDPAQRARQGKNSRAYHASLDPDAKARWVQSIREGKARAKRVRREVGVIFLALLLQRSGTA